MSTISYGTHRFAYTGRLAPVLPVTDFIDRFLDGEDCRDRAALLAKLMLRCAQHAHGRFALLRDETHVHAILAHTDETDPATYHAHLVAEHGPLFDEYAEEWGTDPGDPEGDEPNTYAAIPRHP